MTTSDSIMDKRPSLYIRQATGLVREISTGSSIAINAAFLGLGFAFLIATQEPFAFPGGSPFWTIIIGGLLCAAPALLYALFTAAMPRTGGEYIFISRSLHPSVGFVANFNLTVWYVLSAANLAFLTTSFGLSSAFVTYGVATDTPTLVQWGEAIASNNSWGFAIGATMLVLTTVAVSVNLRSVLRIFNAIFLLSIVGILVSVVLLLIHDRADFVLAVLRFGGDYSKVITDALHAGYAGSSSFDLGNTILATPLAFISFGFVMATAYAGAELQSPQRVALQGMFLALVIGVVLTAVGMALTGRTIGNNFLGAATYLSNTGNPNYPFKAPAFFFFFVSMLTNSPVLIALIGMSFVVGIAAILPPSFMAATRSIFAWSFDRIIPSKLSEVHERTHAPLIANLLVLAVSLVFLTLLVYGPSTVLHIVFTTSLGQLVTFILVAIAGIAFPFRQPSLYETSSIKKSLGGIPLVTAVGMGALIVYGLFFYVLVTRDVLGANSRIGITTVITIALSGILIYLISYVLNRRRGIDLLLASRELPPE